MNTPKAKSFLYRLWKEWRMTLALIVLVVLPVKSSLAEFNWVPTGSMKPTILEGDFLLVNKLAYDLRMPYTRQRLATWSNPQRGDIAICFSPADGKRLVKRVIGLPGDTLEMHDNQLMINGSPVSLTPISSKPFADAVDSETSYCVFAMEDLGTISHPVMTTPQRWARRHFESITIPEDRYFVMGDNRDNSMDSRSFGFVSRDRFAGKAVGIVGSIDITDRFQPRLKRFMTPLQ